MPELIAEGRMREAGLQAYERRTDARSAIYAYEQDEVAFDPAMREVFQANAPAWAFFESAPAGYRRAATWWVISAKREETRQRRLRTLIDDSAQGLWITLLRREPKPGKDA